MKSLAMTVTTIAKVCSKKYKQILLNSHYVIAVFSYFTVMSMNASFSLSVLSCLEDLSHQFKSHKHKRHLTVLMSLHTFYGRHMPNFPKNVILISDRDTLLRSAIIWSLSTLQLYT